jgi:hypothetical protein
MIGSLSVVLSDTYRQTFAANLWLAAKSADDILFEDECT